MNVDVFLAASSVCVPAAKSGLVDCGPDQSSGVAKAIELVAAMAGSWRRPRLRVWLSSAWVRPFVIQPVAGLKSWAEAEALARAQAPFWSGAELAIVLDQWPGGATRTLALAASAGYLSVLREQATKLRVGVGSIKPWWGAPNCIPKRSVGSRMLAASDPDGLTLLVANQAEHFWATCYTPAPDLEQQDALLRRTLTGQNLAPEVLHVVKWSEVCSRASSRGRGSDGHAAVPRGHA